VSHDPSEITLIWYGVEETFLIIIINGCTA